MTKEEHETEECQGHERRKEVCRILEAWVDGVAYQSRCTPKRPAPARNRGLEAEATRVRVNKGH